MAVLKDLSAYTMPSGPTSSVTLLLQTSGVWYSATPVQERDSYNSAALFSACGNEIDLASSDDYAVII